MKRISVFDPSRAVARFCVTAAAALLLTGPAGAVGGGDAALDPHGVWLRPEGGEQFSFYDCGAQLCAKLVSVKKGEDEKSIGTVILRGAEKSGPNQWKGKLFNAENGKTYDGVITVKSPTELSLKGCLWGVLCSGETWKRVAAVAPSAKAKAREAAVADAPAE
ncbi:MAG: hypothetical protein CTY15_08845 [Methylocystis sp.]|nr:MAG: hypothetical protein CTY15_08845 [Methylocystis sp.]